MLVVFLFSNFADILFMKLVHDMNIEFEMGFFSQFWRNDPSILFLGLGDII